MRGHFLYPNGMKNPKINCPRCNSLQSFGQQRRRVAQDEYEIFVKCTKCHYELLVTSGSSDKILNDREISKLRARATIDPRLREVLNRKLRKGVNLE
jgi:hypothetical protein